jgi:sulfonate transport system permease protein
MSSKHKSSLTPSRIALRSVIPVLVVGFWVLATTRGWIDPKIWASPSKVADAWRQLTLNGFLWKAIEGSLLRETGGFLLGAVVGFLVGNLLGLSRIADWLATPLLGFLKQISVFAWLPLISLFFGIGEWSKAVFIGISAFFPLVTSTYAGLHSVQRNHAELARLLRLSPWQRYRKILLPAALPAILGGIQLGLVLTWMATVGADFFMSAGYSIGGFLIQGASSLKFGLVIIGVALLGIIGWGLDFLTRQVGGYLLRNRPKTLQA